MKQFLRSIATGALSFGGAYPTPRTPDEVLTALMRSLYPVHPGVDLIRLGPDGDGGYLVPDDLDGIEACFSPGVSDVSGFELDCAERGMKVFMADWSVDQPPDSHPAFSFEKKYLGALTNDQFMTLDDWVASALPESESELIVQMDIERFEYETLLRMSDSLMRRIRILIVEFHDLDDLWSKPFFDLASRAFEKILQTHVCVHIHPNNDVPVVRSRSIAMPPLMEFTFLRSDRVNAPTPVTSFPHPLDRDNTPNPPITLPRHWYAGG